MEEQPSIDKKHKMTICPKCGRLGNYKEQSKPSGTRQLLLADTNS